MNNIPFLKTEHKFIKKKILPSFIIEWNDLDRAIRAIYSFSTFKESILHLIQLSPNSVYNFHNPKGIKFIARIKLGQRHLREHKLKRSFQDWFNLLYNCGCEVESTTYFFLHCPIFIKERRALLRTISNIDTKLLDNVNYV